jgi:hypothetical protein
VLINRALPGMLGSQVTGQAREWAFTYSEKPMAFRSFTDMVDLFEQGSRRSCGELVTRKNRADVSSKAPRNYILIA